MTAFSYIRFSSAKQELGDSLRRQHEKAVEWCKSNNIELSNKSFNDLGISGFKEAKRPSLDDMFTCIENGSIKKGDVIILESLDRLSRKGIDHTQDTVKKILRTGVEIVDLTNGIRLTESSLNDVTSVIRVAIAADLAHKESLQKSKRVQAAKSAGAELAKRGVQIKRRLPFWLSWKDGTVVLNDKSEIVSMTINWRLAGRGLQGIAKDLNEMKHPSPNGRGWTDQTVRYMFENATVYGAYKMKDGTVIDDYYPAVTDYATWLAIQPHRVKRAGGHSHMNTISGITFCAECGYAMKLKTLTKSRKSKSYTYRYWVCRGRENGTCTESPKRDLDERIMKLISKITVPSLNADNSAIDAEIDRLKTRVSELEAALISGVSVSAIMVAIKKCNEQVNELSGKRVQTVDASDLKSLTDITDPVEFNAVLRRIVKKIVVDKSSVIIQRVDGHKIRATRTGLKTDSFELLKQIKDMTDDEPTEYYE